MRFQLRLREDQRKLSVLKRALSPVCLLAVCLFVGTVLEASAADVRFGFVGTGGKAFAQKFGVPYYALEGNYHSSTGTLFSSVHPDNDPPTGHKVLRKVAKLNVRTDSLGQSDAQSEAAFEAYGQALVGWYLINGARPPKPGFTWYVPPATALAQAESTQIVATIRREKQLVPPVTGTVWEIGNEPNFFPAILPAEYAALYANYHRIIKREDSTAKVAFGPLFVLETGADFKLMTRELLTLKFTNAGALALLGQSRFDSLMATVDSVISGRIFSRSTVEYASQAFAALPPDVRPDYLSLHVYPYDDRAPALSKADIQAAVDSLVIDLAGITGGKPVWITEFGNINPALTASVVAANMSDLIDVFTSNAAIGNLFYYKATGSATLDFLAGFGAGAPANPLTRLAIDSAFSPTDGNFSCSELNAIGLMYYQRAVGVACTDAVHIGKSFSPAGHGYSGVQVEGGRVLRFNLDRTQRVRIEIRSLRGERLYTSDKSMEPGSHAVFLPEQEAVAVRLLDLRIGAERATLKLIP
jgi:hypothetical protein